MVPAKTAVFVFLPDLPEGPADFDGGVGVTVAVLCTSVAGTVDDTNEESGLCSAAIPSAITGLKKF